MIATIAALLGLSERLTRVGLIALLVLGLGLAKCAYDRSVIARHEAGVTARVQATTDAANDKAAGAVNETRSEVQKGNDDARKAANAGTDPLGDGLRSLRAEAGKDRPAAR